ncbi:PAS domain S-box protein [Pseudanabaena sp. UWO310]|uniref:PAS domain S-box protein n=1 Tax=Pseudanabaena sp. UWO310 TaxID=2480795 RepID=UPI00115BE7C0|nr:PAS domain S-box protein [Pseudanabaena sp. UWO310]TYQ27291.1 PAS domain S-box protein [Pseudanabaena sp. UWO310]
MKNIGNLKRSNIPTTKILLVEDDLDDRLFFVQALEQVGLFYDYVMAASFTEAIAILSQQELAIAIVKSQLRDGEASQLLPSLQNINCPYIITLANGEEETATKLIAQGATNYLIRDRDRYYLKMLPAIIKATISSHQTIVKLQEQNQALNIELQERITAEKNLRDREDRYQQILDSIPDLILVKESDSRVVWGNKTFRDFYGISLEHLQGKMDAPFNHPDFTSQYIRDDNFVFSTGQTLHIPEESATRRDGSVRLMSTIKTPIFDEDGEVRKIVVISHDITARKEATNSLKESERRFKTLAAVVPVGIFRTDKNGNCIYVNEQWSEIAGLSLEEALGEGWATALHPDDRDKINNEWYLSAQQNRPFKLEYRFLRKDGSTSWVLGQSLAEVDLSGKIFGYVGSITDISDRRKAELTLQKLVEGTAALTGLEFFPAVVSHIAEALAVPFVSVTELIGDHLHTLSFWAKGSLQPSIAYPVQDTPCEYVLRDGEFYCENQLQTYFFNDPYLEEMQADSYLGIALKDNFGNAIGNLCIIDTKPLDKSKYHESIAILRIFGARVAAELERKAATEALYRLNQDLEIRVEHRTKALQESEIRFRRMFDSNVVGMLFADFDGNILDANDRFLQMIGYSREEFNTGKIFWHNLTPPEHVPSDYAAMGKLMEHGFIHPWEKEYYRKDGSRIPVLIGAAFLPGTENQTICVVIDISDRKQYETQLKQTNAELAIATRLKDEFLANMSHELRTPLNAILGMTESLQDEVFGSINEHQKKSLNLIENSGLHLLKLINDILDLAKIESGQVELDLASSNIEVLCQSSLAFIKQQSHKKRIQIETKISPDLPHVSIDERRILQVLINLLSNAVKFTPEGGRIVLEVSDRQKANLAHSDQTAEVPSLQEYVQIKVIDTGIGISPENIDKLFQPFIQIDSALNRQYEGTGLGLSLVKRIVELHGGQVSLVSEVGVGSSFTITLPYADGQLVSPAPETQPEAFTAPENNGSELKNPFKILLVDDNEANLITIESYLSARGYDIILASNGEEAIALAQLQAPDLILMDIQMPGTNGLETIKQMRQIPSLANQTIIALTALTMQGDREKCIAAGANEYLAKPVKLRQLVLTIQQLHIKPQNL